MNDIEYVFGTGDPLAHHWCGHADLAHSSLADALWVDYDAPIDDMPWSAGVSFDDELLPDIPHATVDHRTVLAQDPPVSERFDGS
ncbi:hypothetical protein [Nocardia sp. NPDC058666]|uniref:hypothetical protein n=1 Tax=unclassified Nocardia TaxID=2637762 RepID=UPI0036680730